MSIIDRYLSRKFIISFLYCVTAFLSLDIIIDASSRLYYFVSHNISPSIIANYYFLIIPHEIVRLLPVSILLSTLHNLGELSRFNEYTAIKASGVSLYRLIAPLLAIASLVSILSFTLNEYLVPPTWSKALKLKERYISPKRDAHRGAQFNRFYSGMENHIFFIQTVNEEGTLLEGVQVIQEESSGNIVWRLDSRQAEWSGKEWLFYDGIIREFSASGEIKTEELFKEKIIYLTENPQYFSRRQPLPEEMSSRELKRHIKMLEKKKQHPLRERVSLCNKISFPLMNLVIIFLGIPFALTSPRSSGLMIGLAISLGISFIYYTIAALGEALGGRGFIPPFMAAWLGNILTITGGLALLIRVRK